MALDRRDALGGLVVGIAAATAVILGGVLDAVFLAVVAGYILFPLHRELVDRGLSPRVSGGFVSVLAFVIAGLLFVPVGIVLYFRRSAIVAFVTGLPPTFDISFGEMTVTVDLGTVQQVILPNLADLALSIARSLSILSMKLIVFAFVVFGIVYAHDRVSGSLFAMVPTGSRDVVADLHAQTERLLHRRYAIPLVAAAVTYIAALATFGVLGYRILFTIALIAAVFRLLPIVSPALLIAGIAVGHLLVGQPLAAIRVVLLGGILVALAPRVIMRWVTGGSYSPVLPTSLFIAGLVGGFLTVGLVGLVAGPLGLALLVQLLSLLADETA